MGLFYRKRRRDIGHQAQDAGEGVPYQKREELAPGVARGPGDSHPDHFPAARRPRGLFNPFRLKHPLAAAHFPGPGDSE